MKTSGDIDIQKQQFLDDSNSFWDNTLNSDYDERIKYLSENYEQIQNELKQSFVVDWQIPENT